MKEKNPNRNRIVGLRFTAAEFKKVDASFKQTTFRKLSGYLRNVILDKPVTVYTRNKSYDEFVADMVGLKRELNAIGNNINQAVKKLHTMTHDDEIKAWAVFHQNNQQFLFKKIAEIELKISKMSERWSQG
jgi:hypothetical protein